MTLVVGLHALTWPGLQVLRWAVKPRSQCRRSHPMSCNWSTLHERCPRGCNCDGRREPSRRSMVAWCCSSRCTLCQVGAGCAPVHNHLHSHGQSHCRSRYHSHSRCHRSCRRSCHRHLGVGCPMSLGETANPIHLDACPRSAGSHWQSQLNCHFAALETSSSLATSFSSGTSRQRWLPPVEGWQGAPQSRRQSPPRGAPRSPRSKSCRYQRLPAWHRAVDLHLQTGGSSRE
mmetsp:Transcript_19505/g.45336  ORF Transcript_19505/g.45336 Transcript_19505/m.45336 type:complete len:231 (-) Transcript_19505:917-1609(-)